MLFTKIHFAESHTVEMLSAESDLTDILFQFCVNLGKVNIIIIQHVTKTQQ